VSLYVVYILGKNPRKPRNLLIEMHYVIFRLYFLCLFINFFFIRLLANIYESPLERIPHLPSWLPGKRRCNRFIRFIRLSVALTCHVATLTLIAISSITSSLPIRCSVYFPLLLPIVYGLHPSVIGSRQHVP
jgi:hypothetical protein